MSELSEQELAKIDLAVGQVERLDVKYNTYQGRLRVIRTIIYDPPDPIIGKFDECVYQPTRDPAEAMRLQAKYLLTVGPRTLVPEFGETQQEWYACALNSPFNAGSQIGPTPCIAICRAVIAHGAPK